MMRSEKAIRERLAEIVADERYHYQSARVDVNAPLALIQTAMEAEATALAWVLNESKPKKEPTK